MQIITAPSYKIKNSNDTIFYDTVGNFIPPEWKNLTSNNGKVLSKTAIQILSLLVSRIHSEKKKAEELEKNGIINLNELQETYYYFEKLLGLCQRRIRQCLVELEKSGYIKLTLINMTKQYIKYRNVICISLTKKFAPCPKKISGQTEKNFGVTRNNFRPHNIIDNNKSINKSRYEESDFENVIFDRENTSTEDISDSDNKPILESKNENLAQKVIGKAKISGVMKKAEEFHPLTEKDAEWLKSKSGRDFNLSFINKLLLKLASDKPNNRFNTKEKLLNYMAIALMNEKRDPNSVNNENFNFKCDYKTQKAEKYLKEIEYSSDVSPQAQLRRKIASVFERDTAYELLQACIFSDLIEGEEYILKSKFNINLSTHMKSVLLRQIQAVYGNKVKRIKIIISNVKLITKPIEEKQEVSIDSYIKAALIGLDPIWRNVREYLIKYYGKVIDETWFSKLKLVQKDEINNKIFLKPETSFIGSRITADYFIHLKAAFERLNYSYELIKA